MKCNQCGQTVAVNEKGICARCESEGGSAVPSAEPWQELLGTAAILGAFWLGGKVLKSAFGNGAESRSAGVPRLPEEFQQSRSRSSTEVPGEPSISAQLELQKLLDKRQHAAQMGKLLMNHMTNMNKITLGIR